jgi:phosphate transport system permease protein
MTMTSSSEAFESVAYQGATARRGRPLEAVVQLLIRGAGMFVLASTLLMFAFLGKAGIAGIRDVGLVQLLTDIVWKPEHELFGGVPLIFGTLVSALGALVVGALPAVLTAIWVSEFAPKLMRPAYRRLMEMSAAVPSVVFGWLALVHLVPVLERVAHLIYGESASVGGEGLAASALLLGFMVAPTVFLLSLDSLSRVPKELRDASAALGASPWQTALSVVVPSSWRGLVVATFFGFARAAGETMAVQMVIGGARQLPSNAFTPTTTISTQIVMDMQNARPDTTASNVLFSMALLLLVVSTAVVLGTRLLTHEKRA